MRLPNQMSWMFQNVLGIDDVRLRPWSEYSLSALVKLEMTRRNFARILWFVLLILGPSRNCSRDQSGHTRPGRYLGVIRSQKKGLLRRPGTKLMNSRVDSGTSYEECIVCELPLHTHYRLPYEGRSSWHCKSGELSRREGRTSLPSSR